MSVCGISINGRLTGYGVTAMSSYEDAKPYRSEINANNSFNSYFGFLVQGNEYRTRTKIFKMLPHEWYVYFNITNRRKVTIKRKYRYDKCNQEPHLRKAAA